MRASIIALFWIVIATTASSDDLLTYYEKSGYKETPRYAETIDYCKRLAAASRSLHYTTFGQTPQGRDLPLLIADSDRRFEASRVQRKKKAVLLIQAGIHSGEIDGKEAGFMLLRDIAVRNEYPGLLDHVTILFIPIFNVDGHERFGRYNRINQNGPKEMGWRTTAQNLNLNRDYLKADAPEMQAWIRLFNEWLPDFFIDCHVTDGADYQYVVTYIMDTYGNMAPGLTDWTRGVYLEDVKGKMHDSGFDLIPYVFLLDWPNPREGMRAWVASPRFSNGYTAIRSRPGLLIETHMLKDYKTRVTGTYELLKHTVEVLNRDYESLKDAIAEADAFTASREFRSKPFALQFEPTGESVTIDFKGFENEAVESELSGGVWYKFKEEPETFEIEFQEAQRPSVLVDLPEAYIIPAEWTDVIERLELHGVETRRLDRATRIEVDSYRFENVAWRDTPYEGRHPVTFEVEKIKSEREFLAGAVIVDMNQAGARVAAHILEPEGPDSYVFWGFFDVIFEQKEGYSSYVMEEMAREMLERDPALRVEFEQMKQEDAEFAGDQGRVLDWFYQRSLYWDDRKDVYPVGKIFDRNVLSRLKTS